jgi:hypothetical protein
MEAAGMSGFGALVERPAEKEVEGWKAPTESRIKLALQAAVFAQKLGRHDEALGSLQDLLGRRVKRLEVALGILAVVRRGARGQAKPPAPPQESEREVPLPLVAAQQEANLLCGASLPVGLAPEH